MSDNYDFYENEVQQHSEHSMTDQELIQALAQTVEDLMATIDELMESNCAMSNTIQKKHWGLVTAERRKLRKEVEMAFLEAESIAAEGRRMHDEYSKKINELNEIMTRFRNQPV